MLYDRTLAATAALFLQSTFGVFKSRQGEIVSDNRRKKISYPKRYIQPVGSGVWGGREAQAPRGYSAELNKRNSQDFSESALWLGSARDCAGPVQGQREYSSMLLIR